MYGRPRPRRNSTCMVDLEHVDYLEEFTGQGSVYACKPRTPKSCRSKMYAYVQFESHESAMKLIELATLGRLVFRSAALKVQFLPTDIVSKPKAIPVHLDRVKLHMGCLISPNHMYLLMSNGKLCNVEFTPYDVPGL